MSTAIRKASNVIITAARLYKEFAVSASDLLRPATDRVRRTDSSTAADRGTRLSRKIW